MLCVLQAVIVVPHTVPVATNVSINGSGDERDQVLKVSLPSRLHTFERHTTSVVSLRDVRTIVRSRRTNACIDCRGAVATIRPQARVRRFASKPIVCAWPHLTHPKVGSFQFRWCTTLAWIPGPHATPLPTHCRGLLSAPHDSLQDVTVLPEAPAPPDSCAWTHRGLVW